MLEIPIDGIKSLVYDDRALNCFVTDNGKLHVESNINPTVIDDNFNELDSRLSDVESQLKLKFNGEIQRIKGELDALQNQMQKR